jgi:hypothetical protein
MGRRKVGENGGAVNVEWRVVMGSFGFPELGIDVGGVPSPRLGKRIGG